MEVFLFFSLILIAGAGPLKSKADKRKMELECRFGVFCDQFVA